MGGLYERKSRGEMAQYGSGSGAMRRGGGDQMGQKMGVVWQRVALLGGEWRSIRTVAMLWGRLNGEEKDERRDWGWNFGGYGIAGGV